MNDRDTTHIRRLKEELAFVNEMLEGITREHFLSNKILQHAVTMSIITLGECTNRLSDEFKENYKEIEWTQITAVRNIAAHGYWQLKMEQIWQMTIEDMPILETFCEQFNV